eukprot:1056249-Rhodomonas_salina.1
MTEAAFEDAAQTVFKTKVAALLNGVGPGDVTITGTQEVSRRRALLAAGLKVDYEVANLASEAAVTAASSTIREKSAELVSSLKEDA